MHEGGEALMAAIPTGEHTFELVQPSEQALDLPAAQGTTILSGFAASVHTVWRNQLNPLGHECLIERITVVGTLPDKSSGSS
jgi:hypothetical protein